MNYCPLNIFSGYTFLSSTLKIEDIFSICDKMKYPYFGINDLVNMHAYSNIESTKKKFKAKPLFGSTIIFLVNDEFPLQISLYITNETGYQNLIKIISLYPEGITFNELKNYSEGLLAIVPTLSNKEIRTLLIDHDLKTLNSELSLLKQLFSYFYLGIEIYEKDDIYLTNLLRTFARENNYLTVAFNKHLYLKKSDAIGLEILSAIKKDTKISIKEKDGPYYFLSLNALKSLYTEDELNVSGDIVDLLKSFNFNIKRGKLLSFPLEKPNKKEYLRSLCLERLSLLNITDERYLSRIDYELDIIEKMGFLDYFLIVRDYVQFAKKSHLPVGPGRGSSAGSLISYLLDITEVDSIKYDLLFERFLNPERISFPDIDIDFADYCRDDIISYINNKYGKNKTASIITFQTIGPKQAIRDIGRVFSYNNNDINLLSQNISHSSTFKDAYKNNYHFRQILEDDYFLDIIKLAKRIEGLPRQSGIHAAGIIINDEDLINSLPIHYNNDGSTLTQFEAPLLESLGFLKMDILSLTNLTIIENIEKYIHEYHDKDFSLKNIPLNDQKTFDVLNKGLTAGIFQLESKGITKAVKEVIINNFDDLVAILALYRPGPMDNIPLYAKNKNFHLKVDYIHPLLKDILSPTYGVIIYQEQIMQIVQKCAGFTLGKADLFRKAISKKDAQTFSKMKDDFIDGCLKNNLELKSAQEIFELINKFANYGFNKSHTVSYALVSYQMAYLKANYPDCFFSGLLNQFSLSDPRIADLNHELNLFSLKLHLPSITLSKNKYVIKDQYLFLPFTTIKGINKNALEQIERIQQKDITDFSSFMKYAEEEKLSDEIIVLLINSGCFDEFNKTRQTLRSAMNSYRLYYQNISHEGLLTQEELTAFLPIIEDEEENERLKYELEYNTLGLLLSGSLFTQYQKKINELKIKPLISQLNNLSYGIKKIAVIIKKVKIIKTKNKEAMATCLVQDDTAQIEVVVFPRVYVKYLYLLKVNQAVIIKGHFQNKDDEISFISDEIELLEEEK